MGSTGVTPQPVKTDKVGTYWTVEMGMASYLTDMGDIELYGR